MMRYWIGTALLAGSWLFGLGYFYPASPYAWLVAVVAAVVLLGRSSASSDSEPFAASQGRGSEEMGTGTSPEAVSARSSCRGSEPVPISSEQLRLQLIAIALFLPAVWFASWPYRAAPLLIVLGLAIRLLPARKRWIDWLAAGAVLAGVVMLVQALTLELYAAHTARSHELPWPLPDLLAGVATLLGIDATVDGSNVVMHSMRQVHRLGATWEMFLDPATLLFLVGGAVMLASCGAGVSPAEENAGGTPALPGAGWRGWMAGVRALALVVVLWLPVRAGLLMAVYLHRVLRSDPDLPLHAMNHFFAPWMLLSLLIVPVLLAWRFVRILPSPTGRGAGGEGSENSTASALTRTLSQGERGQSSLPPTLSQRERGQGDEVPSASPLPLPPSPFRLPVAAGLVALAVAVFTAAVYWCPMGGRKEGRVMVVERHSKWEPTTEPYDTKWFTQPEPFPDVNSGYNYARIYRYLGQYYDMSRLVEKDKIDDETLSKCDVLIVKTPTERYSKEEVAAVLRFVEQGGGVLFIGDHTNFESSSTIMNDMTRPMGFIFRDDLLFSLGDLPYEQSYMNPAVPHPAAQYFSQMDFAVSCSIDPGWSHGRPVIENTGLFSMGSEYHYDNFHPHPQHCPAMRYGAFVQTWAARHKQGRAIAFTDSTIFSNFSVGQPGKSELMLGMVEWLYHRNAWFDPRPWLILLGLVPLAAVLWMGLRAAAATPGAACCRQWRTVGLILLAAGTCGWVVASLAVAGVHRWSMPTPECVRPERCVVIDRTTSTVPLSKGAYTRGGGVGYGLFEQWLARLDCRTVRKEGSAAFAGDALVVICPNRSVTEKFRNGLEQYVNDGGKLLLIDSPENNNSTANSLLWPFGLSIHHDRLWKGKLTTAVKLPTIDAEAACEVAGGQPVANLGEHAVAAVVRHGKGTVMAVGFGSLWNDTGMGETWTIKPDADGKVAIDFSAEDLPGWTLERDADGKLQPQLEHAMSPGWMLEPSATVRTRYDQLFGLVRHFLDDKPWPAFPQGPPKKPDADKDSPLKESGPADL